MGLPAAEKRRSFVVSRRGDRPDHENAAVTSAPGAWHDLSKRKFLTPRVRSISLWDRRALYVELDSAATVAHLLTIERRGARQPHRPLPSSAATTNHRHSCCLKAGGAYVPIDRRIPAIELSYH